MADPSGRPLVLAAVSGGADSLALGAGLAAEAPGLLVRAGAVVVDHQLQESSDCVAARAAGQCRALGLDPVVVVPVEVRTQGEGVEAAARSARYHALEDTARRLGAALVLLGHTRDDQAEQVLLGLARGSGARSLAGMPPRRGRFLRPLLSLGRDTTEAACAAWGLTPFADPMNVDERYARVRARRALRDLEADLGPGLREALARSADLLRQDADHLDELAGSAYGALTPFEGEGPPITHLVEMDPAIRSRVLRLLLLAAGARGGDLSAGHVAEVDRLITSPRGQGPLHLPGVRVRRVGNGPDARLSITGGSPV